MKYNIGDRVLIVPSRTIGMNNEGEMDKYLNTVMTIVGTTGLGYRMKEDDGIWFWYDDMIVKRVEVGQSMKKKDLKAGMVVKTRNGNVYMYTIRDGGRLCLARVGYWTELADNDDLLDDRDSEFDIMEVYEPISPWRMFEDMKTGKIELKHCKLIWERNENAEIGDIVKITDNGKQFTTYERFIREYYPDYLGRFAYNVSLENGDELKVIGFGEHHIGNELYLLENNLGQVFLIGKGGVKKI